MALKDVIPIITLTSDYGVKDYFLASLKAQLYVHVPKSKIIDISHNVLSFDISETAFLIGNALFDFPSKTVHLIAVNETSSLSQTFLVGVVRDQFIVSADNGLLSLLATRHGIEEVIEITEFMEEQSSPFPSRDLFPKVALHLTERPLNALGRKAKSHLMLKNEQPSINPHTKQLLGIVVYIDHFGNAITNVSKSIFHSHVGDKSFEIVVQGYRFRRVYDRYSEIEKANTFSRVSLDGEALAIFNVTRFLEIGIYRSNMETVGGASSLMGIDRNTRVSVRVEGSTR